MTQGWQIGFNIGSAFAEITASPTDKALHQSALQHRWVLTKKSAADGLKEFLQAHPELRGSAIRISHEGLRQTIQRRTGSTIALLVTAGFEDWPSIRQPFQSAHLTLRPQKATPLLTRDYIFGVTERTSATGEVLKAIDPTEIQFLIEKLKFSSIDTVAIGFLHSMKNPENEKTVQDLFLAAGFQVQCSHEIEEPQNEVSRWWRAVLNSYLTQNYKTLLASLTPVLEECELKNVTPESHHPFASCFFWLEDIVRHIKTQHPKAKELIYLGLEEFLRISLEQEQSCWVTEFGSVYLKTPQFEKLSLQPLQEITITSFGGVIFSERTIDYEPGPLLLGRGLRPTLIDSLLLGEESAFAGTPIPDNFTQRSNESFSAHAKTEHMSVKELGQELQKLFSRTIEQELLLSGQSEGVVVAGELASSFSFAHTNWKLHKNYFLKSNSNIMGMLS